MLLLRQI